MYIFWHIKYFDYNHVRTFTFEKQKMQDGSQTPERKENSNEIPKNRKPFWWSLANAKDFLDFRYNTQDEIDKFNEEITITENLDEIINKTRNNNEFWEEREKKDIIINPWETPQKNENKSNNRTDNNKDNFNKDKIKYESWKEKDNNGINESNNNNWPIEWEALIEESSTRTKIYDPFELNFENEEEEQDNKVEKPKQGEQEMPDDDEIISPFKDEDDQDNKKEEEKQIEEPKQDKQEIPDDDEIISPFKDEDEQDNKKEETKQVEKPKQDEQEMLDDDEIISPFKDEDEQNNDKNKDYEYSNNKEKDKEETKMSTESNDQTWEQYAKSTNTPTDIQKELIDNEKTNKDNAYTQEITNESLNEETNDKINFKIYNNKEQEKEDDKDEEETIGIINDKEEKDTTKSKKINLSKDETEEWNEEIENTEDDKEYTKEEIFEQEPEFFAQDELSQQFLELVQNTRNILKLEEKNWNQGNYFKIIWWKTEKKTLEYSFYLIEEPNEPLDLYIKKIETSTEDEESEHLVQFSYNENKELSIFVDEIILYQNINKSDPETTEYSDTKTFLEKFIFLTENYYNELNTKLENEYKEKQKKKKLQQIFKGF